MDHIWWYIKNNDSLGKSDNLIYGRISKSRHNRYERLTVLFYEKLKEIEKFEIYK